MAAGSASGQEKLASGRPATGTASASVAPYDAAIDAFMTQVDCTAATFALVREGRLVYSRGYGYADEAIRTATPPDALMRLASNSKPITAAVIRQLISEGKLNGDEPVFELLGIKPYNGRLGDPRLADVTAMHLLEHKAGWDRDATFDPVFHMPRMAAAMKVERLSRPAQTIEYMLAQPLQFSPGERYAYSNFGYIVLGAAAEKDTGKSFADIVRERIARPLRIEVFPAATAPKDRPLREVHYPREDAAPVEMYHPAGGLVSSAPSLCVFMQHYWLDGRPRRVDQWGIYHHFGSLTSTTCLIEQRKDGICYAMILNGRREDSYNADNALLRDTMNRIITEQFSRR